MPNGLAGKNFAKMGLDTSHDAWHGSYSSFMMWRIKIAELAGFPPLELMEGYYSDKFGGNPFQLLEFRYPIGDELDMDGLRRIKERLPISFKLFEKHPLYILLPHSDCDGYISYGECGKIAKALEELLPLMSEDAIGFNYYQRTKEFIEGCKLAFSKKQKLDFH